MKSADLSVAQILREQLFLKLKSLRSKDFLKGFRIYIDDNYKIHISLILAALSTFATNTKVPQCGI